MGARPPVRPEEKSISDEFVLEQGKKTFAMRPLIEFNATVPAVLFDDALLFEVAGHVEEALGTEKEATTTPVREAEPEDSNECIHGVVLSGSTAFEVPVATIASKAVVHGNGREQRRLPRPVFSGEEADA